MAHNVDRGLNSKLIFPFAVPAEDRIKAFSKDMQMAAILYLAESDRQKGEGHIIKKPEEKLVFIAEVCYPIWLVSWNGEILLFDGLGLKAHTLIYERLPDIRAFNNDILASSKTSEAYSAALTRNSNYFKDSIDKEEEKIENLIASPDFIQDFLVYLSEGEKVEELLTDKAFLSPTIREFELSTSIKSLSDLKTKIDEDAKNLETSMKLLNRTTEVKVKTIREENKKVRKRFDKQIEKVKSRATGKKRRIQDKYNQRIIKISERFERQLRFLHKKQIELKRMQKRLRTEIRRCRTKIKSCKRRKNKVNENQWTQRLKRNRKKLPTLERKIKDTGRKIENLEISQQMVECDTRIEEAMKPLRELEASKEARKQTNLQKIATLQDKTSLIISQMNDIAKSKRAALNELDNIGTSNRKDTRILAYLSFYLVRYELEDRRRYVVYPPSIVSGMGILTKMKSVLGATKLKTFLKPRSKAITIFLDEIVTLLQESLLFEKEVTDSGIQASVLHTRKLRIGVKRGLKELKNEKWISKNELKAFSKVLYMYA